MFADEAVTVYNRAQLEELRSKGAGYLELFKTFGAAVAAQLEDVELVEPEVVYDGAAELDLGGRRAQLRDWGRGHTLGDQTVFLPEQRVLFTGDLVEERCFAIFPWFPPDDVDVDGHRWIAVLRELERLDPAVVVPGHGDVGGVEVIVAAREYLELLRDETERLARRRSLGGRGRRRARPGAAASSIPTGRSRSGSTSARAASTRRTRARHPAHADPLWRATGHSSASAGSTSASAASTRSAAPTSPSAGPRCTASSERTAPGSRRC